MAAVYQVVNKAHTRAVMREEVAVDTRGNSYILRHAAEPIRFEVGAYINDLNASELAAFPDRFQLVSGEMPQPVLGQAPRLNPELFALIHRAHAGDVSNDEAALVGELLTFLAEDARGAATEAQREAMSLKLADFGLELYV
jgi:hypothetical protein